MTFTETKIPLSDTGQFSKLMLKYINSDDSLRKFYEYDFNIQSFKKAIDARSKKEINRKLLVEVVKSQYTKTGIDFSSLNIDSLLDEKTFTVCTGHQLCLFTGPLYFIYKIISTINLSEALKKHYPEYNFLPVYWMASEDHDFEEIKNIHLFGKTISWENATAKGAVGKLTTESLKTTMEELSPILGESENAKELAKLFASAYLQHSTMAEATRYFVHQLFGKYNLIVVDGNDARLKNEFAEIIIDDIVNQTNYKFVSKTISQLEAIELKSQVNPRAINCFYMMDNLRERIEYDESTKLYHVLNTTVKFTKEELLAEIKKYPERFSPNVVLRPLYQQKILPNLAYVGGPGEIAYWLEYKTMFDFHKILFPVLIPRNFAVIMDGKISQQFQKLGFTKNDVFKNADNLVKEYVNKNADKSLLLQKELKEISVVYSSIIEKATTADTTLKASVEAEMQKTLKAVQAIEAKILRSEKQKHDTAINQIKKIKEKLFPEGVLQERYDNFIPYYLKYESDFISSLKNKFNAFEFELLILEEK